MSPPVPPSRPAAPLHPGAALGCGLAGIGLLLGLSGAAAADPSLGQVPGIGEAAWWAVAAVLVVQALAVTWVGRLPTVVLPGTAALPLALAWAVPGAVVSLTAVAELAAVFLAVVAHPLRRLRLAMAATALLLAAGQFVAVLRDGGVDVGTAAVAALLQALVVIGLPLLMGLVVAARRDADESRRQEVTALRREQDALLQAAMSRQRTALSRELHDIAAHHMSGIAVLAAAIDRQIDSDPATAKRSARQIREQSRAVLGDLRRLVGLLREEADAARPVETLDAVSALVEARRAAGADITLVLPAERAEPGPLAQFVAYRMVQESLTNAAVHAPGAPCTVEIEPPRDGWLTVGVRNGAPTRPDPGPGGGFGLVGMAERAQLVGADLDYGPTPDGGWQVRLRLPLGETISTMRPPPSLPEDPA